MHYGPVIRRTAGVHDLLAKGLSVETVPQTPHPRGQMMPVG